MISIAQAKKWCRARRRRENFVILSPAAGAKILHIAPQEGRFLHEIDTRPPLLSADFRQSGGSARDRLMMNMKVCPEESNSGEENNFSQEKVTL